MPCPITGAAHMEQTRTEKLFLDKVRPLLQLTLGCFIYAISISVFYSPAKLLGGGVTGFAQILNFEFGLPVSRMILLMNIPLFILALLLVDRGFTVMSLIGMLLLSGFLKLTSGLHVDFTSPLTAVTVGGVLNGLGLGLIYRSDASAGGTDIISKIIQRFYAGNMAYTGLIMNIAVVGTSAFIYGLDRAVLTICAMYVSSQVDSYIIDGMDHRRAVAVITAKPKEVAAAITEQMKRGATVLDGHGAYTGQEHDMVYCVITRKELAKMKRVIKMTDPEAFFTITRLTGVYGKGRSFHSIEKSIK